MNRELQTIIVEVEKAVVGKREVIEKILMALLADGHVLLDDIPGVGKTTLAVALSRTLGLTYNRIQFTPDVLPSDIVGFSIYNKNSGCFEYKSGVVSNTNLLLGDEINRTSSKTQSALLEAMEERQVTVDGMTYPLQKPFAVIATQNNVGTAGTQLLPYAQMDRFLVRLSIGYPDYEAQMSILARAQIPLVPWRRWSPVTMCCGCRRRCGPSQQRTVFWTILPVWPWRPGSIPWWRWASAPAAPCSLTVWPRPMLIWRAGIM